MNTEIPPLLTTNIPQLKLCNRGKVRDIYEINDSLLIVATDRISAFDVVLPNGIPYKGKVLTGLSEFWFQYTSGIIENHLITTRIEHMNNSIITQHKGHPGGSFHAGKEGRSHSRRMRNSWLSGWFWLEGVSKYSIHLWNKITSWA